MALQAHNRWWARDNTYAAQNGGTYAWTTVDDPRFGMHAFNASLPTPDGHVSSHVDPGVSKSGKGGFWGGLMRKARELGIAVYEQD